MLTTEANELTTLRQRRQRLALDAQTDAAAQVQLELVEQNIDRLTRQQERAVLVEAERAVRATEAAAHRRIEIIEELTVRLIKLEQERDTKVRAILIALAPDAAEVEQAYVLARQAYSLAHDLLSLTGDHQRFHRAWNVRALLGPASARLPVALPGQKKPFTPRQWTSLVVEYRSLQAL